MNEKALESFIGLCDEMMVPVQEGLINVIKKIKLKIHENKEFKKIMRPFEKALRNLNFEEALNELDKVPVDRTSSFTGRNKLPQEELVTIRIIVQQFLDIFKDDSKESNIAMKNIKFNRHYLPAIVYQAAHKILKDSNTEEAISSAINNVTQNAAVAQQSLQNQINQQQTQQQIHQQIQNQLQFDMQNQINHQIQNQIFQQQSMINSQIMF